MRDQFRRIALLRAGLASALVLASAVPLLAATRDVSVTNELDETIYGLYVWPSDLVPRTYSVLSTPLLPNRDTKVKVDDVYGDCVFTFRADLTVPKSLRKQTLQVRRQYRKPRPRSLYVYNVNLCNKKDDAVPIADPVGSNFGR